MDNAVGGGGASNAGGGAASHPRASLTQTPPLAPSAVYAKRAREIQAEGMATARYLPPALRGQASNTGPAIKEDLASTYSIMEGSALPPTNYTAGFRRARAGTLPPNVQLAAQQFAASSGLRTNSGSTESFSEQLHLHQQPPGLYSSLGSLSVPQQQQPLPPSRPSLRHAATSAASAIPSSLSDRNARLRSGSLNMIPNGGSALNGSLFGSSVFSPPWLSSSSSYNNGFPAVDERVPESGMEEYDVHTLDYLGLDDGQRQPPVATLAEMRNQAQAAIASNLAAANPPRLRASTVSNPYPRLARSTTSLLAQSNPEEEDEYFGQYDNAYDRRRYEQEETYGYVAKGFKHGDHLSPSNGLRPRATSVGNAEEPTRPFQRRSTIAEPSVSYLSNQNANVVSGYPSERQQGLMMSMQLPSTRSTSPKLEATSSQLQTPTRSLWIGNLDSTVTSEQLIRVFAPYGAIESLRLLPEKECGFVNFMDQADAIRAKDEVLNRLGGQIGMPNNQAVRIGFGKADNELSTKALGVSATLPGGMDQVQSTPTRALWIGSIPSTTTPAAILSVFSPYGPIESARVLTHKNCGFINFERLDDAVRARKALNGRDILGPDVGAIRIGFAKVPVKNSADGEEATLPTAQGVGNLTVPETIQALRSVKGASSVPVNDQVMGGGVENYRSNLLLSMISSGMHNGIAGSDNQGAQYDITEQQMIMAQLSDGQVDPEEAQRLGMSELRPPAMYYTTIPPVSDRSHTRRCDASKLKELRKKLEMPSMSIDEIDAIAKDFLDGEIVDLASDWLGNTVVQKLFERCSARPRYAMLECISSHLATIGIHKNGTWAAQKIIECVQTEEEVALISQHLRPYVPPLLLDQFGNYVVQCCLRFGHPRTQFIYDAMVDRMWEIAQGRFGARSMRTCLEKSPVAQQRRIATAIILNSIPLATNPNGALLLTWLLDSTNFPKRYVLLAPRFIPHLSHLCTHKLASITVLRLINQNIEPEASTAIVEALFMSAADFVLLDVLADQINGVTLIQKVLASTFLDPKRKPHFIEATKRVLVQLKVIATQAYRRLIEEVGLPISTGPVSGYSEPPRERTPSNLGQHQQLDHNQLSAMMGSINLNRQNHSPGIHVEQNIGYIDQSVYSQQLGHHGGRGPTTPGSLGLSTPPESFNPFPRQMDIPLQRPSPLRRSPSGQPLANSGLTYSSSGSNLVGLSQSQSPPWAMGQPGPAVHNNSQYSYMYHAPYQNQ